MEMMSLKSGFSKASSSGAMRILTLNNFAFAVFPAKECSAAVLKYIVYFSSSLITFLVISGKEEYKEKT